MQITLQIISPARLQKNYSQYETSVSRAGQHKHSSCTECNKRQGVQYHFGQGRLNKKYFAVH